MFKQVDTRLQVNDYIAEQWNKEVTKPKYLKANNTDWNQLSESKK